MLISWLNLYFFRIIFHFFLFQHWWCFCSKINTDNHQVDFDFFCSPIYMCLYVSKIGKAVKSKMKIVQPMGKEMQNFLLLSNFLFNQVIEYRILVNTKQTNRKWIWGKKTYLVQNSIALTAPMQSSILKTYYIQEWKFFFSLAVTHIISFWNDQWWWWW